MSKSNGASKDGENGDDEEKDGVVAVAAADDAVAGDAVTTVDDAADGESNTKLFAWAFICVPVASR